MVLGDVFPFLGVPKQLLFLGFKENPKVKPQGFGLFFLLPSFTNRVFRYLF